MNIVTLIGNLTTEVVQGTDASVATFQLAVDRANEDGTDSVTVVVRDRQAELAAEYLGRGRRVAIDGALRSQDGTSSGLVVVARRIEFLGGPKEAS